MAITDVPAFAHLTDADIENLAVELDAIRLDIEDSRGERDARYIRRTIAAQRALEVAGRLHAGRQLETLGMVGGNRDPRSWPRSSRTWRSATTSCTASGTG